MKPRQGWRSTGELPQGSNLGTRKPQPGGWPHDRAAAGIGAVYGRSVDHARKRADHKLQQTKAFIYQETLLALPSNRALQSDHLNMTSDVFSLRG